MSCSTTYAKRVSMDRIAAEGYNLYISRYISTAVADEEIDLVAVHADLVRIEHDIADAKQRHNELLDQLGLSRLP